MTALEAAQVFGEQKPAKSFVSVLNPGWLRSPDPRSNNERLDPISQNIPGSSPSGAVPPRRSDELSVIHLGIGSHPIPRYYRTQLNYGAISFAETGFG
jgi:hypothetical protein